MKLLSIKFLKWTFQYQMGSGDIDLKIRDGVAISAGN